MVTIKEHVPTLPAVSVLEQFTGVDPSANRLPDGGVQVVFITPQLSVAVVAKLTMASQRLLSQLTVKLLEHVTTGRWVSVTRTVKVQ